MSIAAPLYLHAFRDDVRMAMAQLGRQVDQRLAHSNMSLCLGGEPTFVATDSAESAQWETAPLGEEKEAHAQRLTRSLARQWRPDGLLIKATGKRYPGEASPRWAWTCLWRRDGRPIAAQLPSNSKDKTVTWETAQTLMNELCDRLSLSAECVLTAADRGRRHALVLPLVRTGVGGEPVWMSCPWSLPEKELSLIDGEGSTGLRLPLYRLPESPLGLLPEWPDEAGADHKGHVAEVDRIRVALCIEPRHADLAVFLPPTATSDTFLALVDTIGSAAECLGVPVCFEGFLPPADDTLDRFQVTPDPGVLEVNLPPIANWDELEMTVRTLYATAAEQGLRPWKRVDDDPAVCTGGGCHLTLGGPEPGTSPFVKRPDLLTSLLRYLNLHPSLSYLFCGRYVGATSQAPRPDEGLAERFARLQGALDWVQRNPTASPEQMSRTFKHLLTDLGGNVHRAELCIDKFWPDHNPAGRLGVIELRAFAMPPAEDLLLALMLLLRSLVCWFLERPQSGPLQMWKDALHDRFFLPAVLCEDLRNITDELNGAGYAYQASWLQPLVDFHFPVYGTWTGEVGQVQLRRAHQTWPVLTEDADTPATSRLVDASCERLEILVMADAAPLLLCNDRRVPLRRSKLGWVAGVCYKARHCPESFVAYRSVQDSLEFDWYAAGTRRHMGGALFTTESRSVTFKPPEETRRAPSAALEAPPPDDSPWTLDLIDEP